MGDNPTGKGGTMRGRDGSVEKKSTETEKGI